MIIKKYTLSCLTLLVLQTHSATHKLIKQDADSRSILNLAKPFLPKNPVILEAGAYNGNDTTVMASIWPNGTIHAFEPQPTVFQTLLINTKILQNVRCYCLGLNDKEGTATFYDSEHTHNPGKPFASGSLLQPKVHLQYSPSVKFEKKIEVPVTTINNWAKQHNIRKIDFMWLDLQGLELPVLMAATDILTSVRAIYAEVSFVEAYAKQYLYKDIKKWLEQNGFVLFATDFTLSEEKEPSIDRWYGNALFVRPN